MSVNWPTALPSVNLTGWKYTKQSAVLKSEMEIGPPKRRKRATSHWAVLTGTLDLTQAQFEAFTAFVETDLKGGIEYINWPDFISGNTKLAALSVDSKGELYTVTQTSENTFRVQLKLEIQG